MPVDPLQLLATHPLQVQAAPQRAPQTVTVVNLEVGIKRAVAAKLRERGLSERSANALADLNMTRAKIFFDAQLVGTRGTENDYDEAYAALMQWVAQLAI